MMAYRHWQWLVLMAIVWSAILPQARVGSEPEANIPNPSITNPSTMNPSDPNASKPSSANLSDPSAIDPNTIQSPEPGWGIWHPRAEINTVPFYAGFSNIELGGFLDFQAACAAAMGVPPEQISEKMDSIPYWFRLNDLVDHLGTGNVEYGCWVDGTLRLSQTLTAIRIDADPVSCLRSSRRLVVYAAPSSTSKRVGIIRRDSTVDPGSYPAIILELEGETWVHIDRPVNGWILHGESGKPGNLSRCQPSPVS